MQCATPTNITVPPVSLSPVQTVTLGLCDVCHFNNAASIWKAGKKYCSDCQQKEMESKSCKVGKGHVTPNIEYLDRMEKPDTSVAADISISQPVRVKCDF
jgi:hypothetical protein